MPHAHFYESAEILQETMEHIRELNPASDTFYDDIDALVFRALRSNVVEARREIFEEVDDPIQDTIANVELLLKECPMPAKHLRDVIATYQEKIVNAKRRKWEGIK